MKRNPWISFMILLMCFAVLPVQSFAWQGDIGYEGGISTGQIPNKKLLDYKEIVYLSGKPIEMSGTLLLKKSLKKDASTNNDSITTVYTVSLKNPENKASLERTVSYLMTGAAKDNGQVIQNTEITGNTTEVVKIDQKTYTLQSMEFTQSALVDKRPALEYFSGDFQWRKKYKVTGTDTYVSSDTSGTGIESVTSTASISGEVKVAASGSFTGFNGYWGSAETVKYLLNIDSETKRDEIRDPWGGSVTVTNTLGKNHSYREYKTEAQTIPFSGGLIEQLNRKGVLKARARLPIFDSGGFSTYSMEDKLSSLEMEAFPETRMLKVVNTSKIAGHWAKKDIDILMGLDVLGGNGDEVVPEKSVTRGEFVDGLVRVMSEVPKDPFFVSKTKAATKTATKGTKTIFSDVNAGYSYKANVEQAFAQGIISGRGNGTFSPDELISFADAITMVMKGLGLDRATKWQGNVMAFKDNDAIPAYARDAIFAAARIGLVKGDPNGFLRPLDKLSYARVAVVLNRVRALLNESLVKEYSEELLNFTS